MARQLKSDLNVLKEMFTENHERFRITNAFLDELNCKFVMKNGSFCDIQAHIADIYPSSAPFWSISNEDESFSSVLEALSNTNGSDNNIINQVKILIHQMCSLIDVPVPADLDNLGNASKDQKIINTDGDESDEDTGNGSDEDRADEDEVSDDGDGEKLESDEDDDTFDERHEDDEMLAVYDDDKKDLALDDKNAIVINRLIKDQFDKPHANQSSSKILLEELKTIFKSNTFKTEKAYSIELINDSLYDWNVTLLTVCPGSLLNEDLAQLKRSGGKDSIQMRVMFKETYPFDPPFIQVTYPAIRGGHVLDAGALCMELLTKQGWSSAYSMENVFIQILSTFITGNARVDFELTKALTNRPYSLEAAKKMFKYHEDHHEKNGWVTPANQNS